MDYVDSTRRRPASEPDVTRVGQDGLAALGAARLTAAALDVRFASMEPVTDATLREMVETIVRAVDPERIVLFGSRAKGMNAADSDVDLLVVDDKPFGPTRGKRREMAKLWRLLARFPVAKDILVYSRDEVERWQGSLNHVIGRALREGRLLYARP